MLAELRALSRGDAAKFALAHFEQGYPKLWVIHEALQLRSERPASFDHTATYEPLLASGPKTDHVIAYVRSGDVIPVVPRFPHRLENNWSGTVLPLPDGKWTDRVTGHVHTGGMSIRISTLLDGFPVALLVRDSDTTDGRDVRKTQGRDLTL